MVCPADTRIMTGVQVEMTETVQHTEEVWKG